MNSPATEFDDVEDGTSQGLQQRSPRRSSFVDYVPPPPRPISPPAKYKLWLLILVSVYFSEWISSEADFVGFLLRTFKLSRNGALFVFLATLVGILVFCVLELIITCLNVKIGENIYGIGPWLKQPRTKWIHGYTNFFAQLLATVVNILENGFSIFNGPVPVENPKHPVQFHEKNGNSDASTSVTLRFESHVKQDRRDDYLAWRDKFSELGCTAQPGMEKVETTGCADDPNVFITYITFANIDYLNLFMSSPVRARLVRNLQPLLEVPTTIQLRKNRKLPDAFTDLCNGQGHPVPKLPPKKWKVWFLTTFGLWLVILFTNDRMPHYHREWGLLPGAHERARALVSVLLNTFLNTYVAVPLLTMFFGQWLKRGEHEKDTKEPWRTLNDGFPSNLSKFLVALAFYGGLTVAWILNET